MSTTIPCRAKNPRTCPYHGNLLRAKEEEVKADEAIKAGNMQAYIDAMTAASEYQRAATVAANNNPEVSDFLAARHSNPIKVPKVGSPYQVINYLPADTQFVTKTVQTQSQLRDAVQNEGGSRGKHAVRQVVAVMNPNQHSRRFQDRNDPRTSVKGPADGRPIVVDLQRCSTDLEVASGNALINATYTGGGIVRAQGNSNVTFITPPGKITIEANEDSRITVVPRDGAYGGIWVSPDAQVEIVEIPGVHHELRINRYRNRNIDLV